MFGISKLSTIIVLSIAVLLIMSGVVSISFRADKISAVPGTAVKIINSSAAVSLKSYIVQVKRKGELFLADNGEQKVELSLAYVNADMEHLRGAIDEGRATQVIVLYTQVLKDSLGRLRQHAWSLSEEALADIKERLKQTRSEAQDLLTHIRALEKVFEEDQGKLSDVADALERELTILGERKPEEVKDSQETIEPLPEATKSVDGKEEQKEVKPLRF